MKFIKRYEMFKEEMQPQTSPSTSPNEPEVHPGTRPTTRPGKPSPFRKDKPGISVKPKAKLKEATIEQVISKFAKLTNQNI